MPYAAPFPFRRRVNSLHLLRRKVSSSAFTGRLMSAPGQSRRLVGVRAKFAYLSKPAVKAETLDQQIRAKSRHWPAASRQTPPGSPDQTARTDRGAWPTPVDSATFLICATAADAPVVLVNRSRVISSSSATGISD